MKILYSLFRIKITTISKTLPLLMLPSFFFFNYFNSYSFALFTSSKNKLPNNINNRVYSFQYPANNPIEDKICFFELGDKQGYVINILDGHAGYQLAQYAIRQLKKLFNYQYQLAKKQNVINDKTVQIMIKNVYKNIQNSYLKAALKAYQFGISKVGSVGSCILTVVIIGNNLYSANLGDCQGIILKTNQNNQIVHQTINNPHNAAILKQQLLLKQKFPNQQDIFVCKNSRACYVKGMLQPTRTLGDFRLKYPQFNNPKNFPRQLGFKKSIKNFNGPYISDQPEIFKFKIENNFKYLVLATDGLWDQLSKEQVTSIVKKNVNNPDMIVNNIFTEALQKSALKNNLTVDQIKQLRDGQKRSYHDDISIIVVDLQNQLKR